MAFQAGEGDKASLISSIDHAKREIYLRLDQFDEIIAIKSMFLKRAYSVRRRPAQLERNLMNKLNERTYTNENLTVDELSEISRSSFELLAAVGGELFVKRYQLTRDVITAYVRNCCERVSITSPSLFQLDQLFPVEELILKYDINSLHLYAMKIKEHRPEAYQSYVSRYAEPMRIIHGIEPPGNEAYSIKYCAKEIFHNLGSRSWNNPDLNWGKVCLMLLILADAVCGLIKKDMLLKEARGKVRTLIDYAAEQTASFIARRDNWEKLKGVNRDTELPDIFMIIPQQQNEEIQPRLFARIPSISSEQFAGACFPPVPPPTPKMVARSEMVGKSTVDLHRYLDEQSHHLKRKRDETD